jgi:hypothetical protein
MTVIKMYNFLFLRFFNITYKLYFNKMIMMMMMMILIVILNKLQAE